MKIERVIEGTVFLVALYIIALNARGMSQIISAGAQGYGTVVRSLQGR